MASAAIRERARQEARALLAAVMADVPPPAPVRRSRPVNPNPSPTAGKPRPDKYDRERIRRMFEDDKLTVKEITEATGAHRGTVSRILTEMGVPLAQRRGPYAALVKCKRGHDMAIHGKPNSGTRGGRYCSECKRERERTT